MGQRGFTIFDVIATMLLVSIVSVAAIWKGPDIVGLSTSSEAEGARGTLRQAQRAAFSSGRPVTVSFQGSRMAACWTAACPAAGGSASPLRDISGTPLAVTLSGGRTFSGAPASITFNADGTASPSAQISIGDRALSVSSSGTVR